MEKVINMNIRNSLIVIIINIFLISLLIFLISILVKPLIYSAIVAVSLSILINAFLILSSNSILLRLNGITKIPSTQIEKIEKIVSDLSIQLDVPKPTICLIPDNNINSLSIGRSSNKSFLCISNGALNMLTSSELQYLCAFEMFKILKRTTAFSTISVATLGIIPILSDKFFRTVFIGIQKKGKESESLLRLLVTGFFLIFAPFFNRLINIFLKKNINSITDKECFNILGSTTPCISTLKKAFDNNKLNIMYSRACANMFFTDPLIGQKVDRKFCYTESINMRIEKLKVL